MSDMKRDPHRDSPSRGESFNTPLDDELMLAQVKAVLTPMPTVDRRHIAQILAATQERKRTPMQRLFGRLSEALEWWRFSTPPLARGASLAAAALTIGFVARGYVMQPGAEMAPTSRMVATQSANTESANTDAARPPAMMAVEGTTDAAAQRVPMQFVLDARDVPAATQVSVVGDFNDWNVQAAPLTLENGVWTVTMPLAPGRHVYAFVVNGETWIADPRAPQATDSDFGRPGSVVIVQVPQ